MIRKPFVLLLFCISACSSGGGIHTHGSTLEIHSMGLNRVILKANCSTIVCTKGFANEGDIWMTDIPLEQLESGEFTNGQIIHLQVLWTPVAGKTPLVSTSTNLSIEHIIISNGQVGVYGGGGYCWMSGSPEKGMQLHIEDATIAIQKSGDGFEDLLTPATMNGKVRSVPDKTIARQIATAAELLR